MALGVEGVASSGSCARGAGVEVRDGPVLAESGVGFLAVFAFAGESATGFVGCFTAEAQAGVRWTGAGAVVTPGFAWDDRQDEELAPLLKSANLPRLC